MTPPLPPALALVAACCRWPDDDARRSVILAAAGADPSDVAGLARRHRVEGLVEHGLNSAGLPVPEAITATAAARRDGTLRQLAETLRISRALGDAGISHHVLKGLPLGVRVYGSLLVKRSWDIDMLVDPADAVAAAKVLAELGHAPAVPPRPLDAAEFARWRVVSKEAELRSADGLTVELHWGLADHPLLLPARPRDLPVQSVDLFGGQTVPTLGDEANLAYLAVHGAGHGWFRLKWLADWSALLASVPPQRRGELLDRAARYGAGRALAQAALLAQRHLGIPAVMVTSDPDVDRLARLAEEAIVAQSSPAARARTTSRVIAQSQRRLMPGPRYAARAWQIRARGTVDRIWLPLPRGLQWLYWPLRPFTAAVRVTARALRRPA